MTEQSNELEVDVPILSHQDDKENEDGSIIKAIAEEEKPDMDEERRIKNAHFYGKRLTEVRNWLADCLGEDSVPPAYELEEHFRSGILLARLANYFAPDLVSLEKIFDLDEKRYHNKGLEYRHTDNIVKWRLACQSVKIKSIILPETADIYAGRNVRTVFALISLAKRLQRLGKAPSFRDHDGFVLTEEELILYTARVITAEEQGIDWKEIHDECHTVESAESANENASVIAEDSVENIDEDIETVEENTLSSLRELCKSTDLSNNLYEEDFALENQKIRLNKLLESNDALKVDLQELEGTIGLLVKNIRSIKDNSDEINEKRRKKEIEKECQSQQFSINNNLSESNEESVYSNSGDGERPKSIGCVSCQTIESRCIDQRTQPDYMLTAKSHVLTLLTIGLQGDSINELVKSDNYTLVDETTASKIKDVQKMLKLSLHKLVEMKQISIDDGNELVTSIFYDIQNQQERDEVRKERKEFYDKMLDNASKNAQQMMAQIEAYRKYENDCLKNMTGGAPSISLSDELNKKVRKFLTRKQQAIIKKPIKMSSEKMIKKGILYMDDLTTPKKVSKYVMVISPLDEPGHYKFESILDGEPRHSQTIIFEDLLRREALGKFRMPFDEPLVLDCLGLRRFLDRKYHSRSFI